MPIRTLVARKQALQGIGQIKVKLRKKKPKNIQKQLLSQKWLSKLLNIYNGQALQPRNKKIKVKKNGIRSHLWKKKGRGHKENVTT